MATFFIGLINLFINALGSVLAFLIGILPTSPFLMVENINIPYLGELNWIIPINLMISLLGFWLLAIASYYLVSIVLRWVKVIS